MSSTFKDLHEHDLKYWQLPVDHPLGEAHHHVQAKYLTHKMQIGIWQLQFGEYFGGSGSCSQMLGMQILLVFSPWKL
jgi:hypothetical protein